MRAVFTGTRPPARAQRSGTSASSIGFSYHPIMRNPAQKWIIKKKSAPVIHIQLESRISRCYDQINRKKNQAEAEIQPVSRHSQSQKGELLAYEKPCCLFIKAYGIDHAGG